MKDQGVIFSRKKKPWAVLLDVQAFQKSRAYFPLEKHTSVEHARVQGFRKVQSLFFWQKNKSASSTPLGHSGLPENPTLQRSYFIAKQIKPFSLSSCPAQLR